VQVRTDHEQHRLLSMIEQMSKEGCSEREIVAALREAGAGEAGSRGGKLSRRSRTNRPVRGRLARWASARRRS